MKALVRCTEECRVVHWAALRQPLMIYSSGMRSAAAAAAAVSADDKTLMLCWLLRQREDADLRHLHWHAEMVDTVHR
eukprot:scaffold29236_cov32-Prasinocladus_malaysianus.AAC.2